MAISGIHQCDLVIYTNKGILVVPIQFDSVFWEKTHDKLFSFFKKFIVPELLTGKILKDKQSVAKNS